MQCAAGASIELPTTLVVVAVFGHQNGLADSPIMRMISFFDMCLPLEPIQGVVECPLVRVGHLSFGGPVRVDHAMLRCTLMAQSRPCCVRMSPPLCFALLRATLPAAAVGSLSGSSSGTRGSRSSCSSIIGVAVRSGHSHGFLASSPAMPTTKVRLRAWGILKKSPPRTRGQRG